MLHCHFVHYESKRIESGLPRREPAFSSSVWLHWKVKFNIVLFWNWILRMKKKTRYVRDPSCKQIIRTFLVKFCTAFVHHFLLSCTFLGLLDLREKYIQEWRLSSTLKVSAIILAMELTRFTLSLSKHMLIIIFVLHVDSTRSKMWWLRNEFERSTFLMTGVPAVFYSIAPLICGRLCSPTLFPTWPPSWECAMVHWQREEDEDACGVVKQKLRKS
jgi:hypothetical protein